jgi:nucleoside-diphosphate-sugar epimerase
MDADAPITLYGESKLALERAIRANNADLPLTILRPPMVLGARDNATLPLFKMASGFLRVKPGLRKKNTVSSLWRTS